MPRFRYNRGSRQRHHVVRGTIRLLEVLRESEWTDEDFNLENLTINHSPPRPPRNFVSRRPWGGARGQEENVQVQVPEVIAPVIPVAPTVQAEVAVRPFEAFQDPMPEDFILNAEPMEVRKLLECPVCYGVILPPVILCSSGHSVCNYCKTRLQSCPTCRGALTTIRNFFAEHFLDKCLLTCRNKDKGCNVILAGGALSEHQERTCEFRPLLCRQCFTEIPYDMYLAHLQTTERIGFRNDYKCSARFEITDHHLLRSGGPDGMKFVWKPIWIHSYENDFFCFLDQSSIAVEQPFWFIWVAAMGTAEVCQKFTCSITIWNKKANKAGLKYEGPIHPIRSQAQTDQVMESGNCLIVLDHDLQNLRYADGIDVMFSVYCTEDDQQGQGTSG